MRDSGQLYPHCRLECRSQRVIEFPHRANEDICPTRFRTIHVCIPRAFVRPHMSTQSLRPRTVRLGSCQHTRPPFLSGEPIVLFSRTGRTRPLKLCL